MTTHFERTCEILRFHVLLTSILFSCSVVIELYWMFLLTTPLLADRSFCVLVISVISSVCSLIYLERPHIIRLHIQSKQIRKNRFKFLLATYFNCVAKLTTWQLSLKWNEVQDYETVFSSNDRRVFHIFISTSTHSRDSRPLRLPLASIISTAC